MYTGEKEGRKHSVQRTSLVPEPLLGISSALLHLIFTPVSQSPLEVNTKGIQIMKTKIS